MQVTASIASDMLKRSRYWEAKLCFALTAGICEPLAAFFDSFDVLSSAILPSICLAVRGTQPIAPGRLPIGGKPAFVACMVAEVIEFGAVGHVDRPRPGIGK